jgi:transcriptional regulator with XRE-family HTH domain
MIFLPVQCQMARAAIGWGVRDLAAASKVSTDTVARFERGEALKERTIEAMQHALEAAGVEFIPENGGGPGVRLRKPAAAPAIPSKPVPVTKIKKTVKSKKKRPRRS